jgi:hypothetical protein
MCHIIQNEIIKINDLKNRAPANGRLLFIPVSTKDSAFFASFDTLSFIGIQEQIKLKKEQFPGWPEQNKPKVLVNHSQQIYTVKSGDTLGAIGRKYRVSVKQIMTWNNLKSTNIQIGQKLVIKK